MHAKKMAGTKSHKKIGRGGSGLKLKSDMTMGTGGKKMHLKHNSSKSSKSAMRKKGF